MVPAHRKKNPIHACVWQVFMGVTANMVQSSTYQALICIIIFKTMTKIDLPACCATNNCEEELGHIFHTNLFFTIFFYSKISSVIFIVQKAVSVLIYGNAFEIKSMRFELRKPLLPINLLHFLLKKILNFPLVVQNTTPDSCFSNNGECEHFCEEGPERRNCSCADGYFLGTDRQSCLTHGINTKNVQIMKIFPFWLTWAFHSTAFLTLI